MQLLSVDLPGRVVTLIVVGNGQLIIIFFGIIWKRLEVPGNRRSSRENRAAHRQVAPAPAHDAGAGVARQSARISRASLHAHSETGRGGIDVEDTTKNRLLELSPPAVGSASIGGRN